MVGSNEHSRKSALLQYIEEKNKQIKAFLEQKGEIQKSFLGCNRPTDSDIWKPITPIPHSGRELDEPCVLEARPSTCQKLTTGISSELVHDITEIARFCTETKMQQDRQEQKLEKLGAGLRSREVETTRLGEELRNFKKAQHIREKLFMEQIDALSEKVQSLSKIIQDLRPEIMAHGSTVIAEKCELQKGSTKDIGSSMQTLDATYFIGDTKYVVQSILPVFEKEEIRKKAVEGLPTVEVADGNKTKIFSEELSDEESEMSVFSY